jgi:hypothetical protein
MSDQIFLIFYIILLLIIIYLYRYYKYRPSITENFDSKKNNVKYDLKNILHDSIFLNTNRGIKMGGIIRDYSNMFSYAYVDSHIVKPDTVNELQNIVERAYMNKKKIRVRGGGHSCSGISIPKKGEILMDMCKLNSYHFDEVGTITLGSGILLTDLKRFLDGQGFEMPIHPSGVDMLDRTSPTVGGFVCAGGISPNSKIFGGLWDNVLEITLVDGYGKKNVYNPNNEIFPWLFGNYGQLGVIVLVKLKIMHIEKNKDFYPLGKKGIIDEFKYKLGDRKCFFYHILCPKEKVDSSQKMIENIISKEYSSDDDKKKFDIVIYYIKHNKFNPPLLYPNNSFYCVQGVQYVDEKDDIYKRKIKNIEKEFLKVMEDNSLYRYPQTEYMDTGELRDYYINRRVYDQFLIYKNRMDPHGIFNYIDNFSEL